MGAGKSTFIKENKLEDFTLSSDELRIKMAGFDMSENGLVISQKKDRQVWAVLYTMLETRMEMGLFTVVDAMHLRTRDFKKYKELADLYGYEIYVKRFDNITLEELLERNNNREPYKRIPEDVIIKKYETFINQVLPEYVTVISDINELYPQPEVYGNNFNEFRHEFMGNLPHDNPNHKESINEHILMCVQNSKTKQLKEISKYHDLGKFICKEFISEHHAVYRNHDSVSAMYYLAKIDVTNQEKQIRKNCTSNATIQRNRQKIKNCLIKLGEIFIYIIF